MRRLAGLLPSGLSTRLGAVVLCALLASNALAMWVLQRSGELIHPIARGQALQRISAAHSAISALSGDEVSRVLQTLAADPGTRIALEDRADVRPLQMKPEERRLAGDLRRALSASSQVPIWMQLERDNGAPARSDVFLPDGWKPLRLRTSVRLDDGRWLNVLQHPQGRYDWAHLLAYTLPVSLLPVLLVSWLVVRRLTAPIRSLARAVERPQFLDGEHVPLPLRGPREARELTTAFNDLQRRVHRHVQARTQMLAMVSHDFRTPLTELRLMLELLPAGTERADMLESLHELDVMVEQALMALRGRDSQEAQLGYDLTELLRDLQRRYARLGMAFDWSLPDASIRAFGRPALLKRGLMNLLDNAASHGSGQVRVALAATADTACVQIRDAGPGLPEAMLQDVFEPFFRGPASTSTDNAGMGLGLSIARACVLAQDGRIVLRNLHPGLAAIVSLPLLPGSSASGPGQGLAHAPGALEEAGP